MMILRLTLASPSCGGWQVSPLCPSAHSSAIPEEMYCLHKSARLELVKRLIVSSVAGSAFSLHLFCEMKSKNVAQKPTVINWHISPVRAPVWTPVHLLGNLQYVALFGLFQASKFLRWECKANSRWCFRCYSLHWGTWLQGWWVFC